MPINPDNSDVPRETSTGSRRAPLPEPPSIDAQNAATLFAGSIAVLAEHYTRAQIIEMCGTFYDSVIEIRKNPQAMKEIEDRLAGRGNYS